MFFIQHPVLENDYCIKREVLKLKMFFFLMFSQKQFYTKAQLTTITEINKKIIQTNNKKSCKQIIRTKNLLSNHPVCLSRCIIKLLVKCYLQCTTFLYASLSLMVPMPICFSLFFTFIKLAARISIFSVCFSLHI